MSAITYHEYENIDVGDSLLIIGFPTTGLVGSIVCNYLIDNFRMKRIGAFLSNDFPAITNISNGKPTPAISVYSGPKAVDGSDFSRLAIIKSEVLLEVPHIQDFTDFLIEWCNENGVKLAISVEGTQVDKLDDNLNIYHVGSMDEVTTYTDHLKSTRLDHGNLEGFSGSLLFKTEIRKFPTITLIAEATESFPDSRAAISVLSVLNELLPQEKLDLDPLFDRARVLEDMMRKSRDDGQSSVQTEDTSNYTFV